MARSTNREVDKHTAGAIVRFERDLAVELGPRKDVPIRQTDVSVVAQRAIGIAQRLLKGYQVRAVPAREGLLTVLAVAVVSLGAVAGPAVVSRQAEESELSGPLVFSIIFLTAAAYRCCSSGLIIRISFLVTGPAVTASVTASASGSGDGRSGSSTLDVNVTVDSRPPGTCSSGSVIVRTPFSN